MVGQTEAAFPHAYLPESPATDDHVVKYADVQQRPHLDRLHISADIFRRRRWVTDRMTVNDDDRGAILANCIAKEFGNPDHARVPFSLVEFADSHHVVHTRQKDDPHVLAVQMRQTRADQIDDVAWCGYPQAFVSRSDGDPPTEFEGSLGCDRLDRTHAGNALKIRQRSGHQSGHTAVIVHGSHGDRQGPLALGSRGSGAPDDRDQFRQSGGLRPSGGKTFTGASGECHGPYCGERVFLRGLTNGSLRAVSVGKGVRRIRCQSRSHQIAYGTAP